MALSDTVRGAALMAGSMAAFSTNDAFMKALSGDLPLAQAIFLRSVGASLVLYALARALGQLRLRVPRQDLGLLALRSVAEIGAAFFFLTAVFNMPLANATAILQALPLAVTLAGALVLGEPVGWRRLTAILVGFLGVLIIVRPGLDGFSIYSLHVLGCIACVTLRDLASRRMSGALPPLTVALVSALTVMAAFALASAFVDWRPVGVAEAAKLSGATICILLAYILSFAAMRVGDIGAVAPFRYAGLLVAMALGVLVFGERLDAATLIGAAIVVGSGLYTLERERRLARRARVESLRQASVDSRGDSL